MKSILFGNIGIAFDLIELVMIKAQRENPPVKNSKNGLILIIDALKSV
jgi:hypothetical protein